MLVGDVHDGLDRLAEEGVQVDLVLSSPPFCGLRAYLPDDHPDKAKEMGLEGTPAEFLTGMLGVVEHCAEVLAEHGSICFEFGDTYSGSGGAGGDYYNEDGLRAGQNKPVGSARQARFDGKDSREFGAGGHPRPHRVGSKYGGSSGRQDRAADEAAGLRAPQKRPGPADRDDIPGWPLAKSACFIPELFGASLAYGRNLLDPEHVTDPWRVRNKVCWVRPNPSVGALGDKVRPAWSMITWACKASDRWFDLDAVRHENPRASEASRTRAQMNRGGVGYHTGDSEENAAQNPSGAPPLDWWDEIEQLLSMVDAQLTNRQQARWVRDRLTEAHGPSDVWELPPTGYKGAHYAVMTAEVCRIPIEASCPRRVCRTCGEPSRRIVDSERLLDGEPADLPAISGTERMGEGASGVGHWRKGTDRWTTGWSTCGCDGTDGLEMSGFHTGAGWRPGIVLDPFGGSGTTGLVATGLGREAILIDLDDRNVALAQERLGMFLQDIATV